MKMSLNNFQRLALVITAAVIATVLWVQADEEGLSDTPWLMGSLAILALLLIASTGLKSATKDAPAQPKQQPQREQQANSLDAVFDELAGREQGDPLAEAQRDYAQYVAAHEIYDGMAGGGKTLSWCCTLLIYAALRVSARRSGVPFNGMAWNSVMRRCSLDMAADGVAISSSFEELDNNAAEARKALVVVNRIVDGGEGQEAGKLMLYLANAFGCAYKPEALRALSDVFEKALSRSDSVLIPHFRRAFST